MSNQTFTDTEILAPISDAHKKRRELFGMYWDYYRGEHRKWLKAKPNQYDDNVILNYSRRVVDKGITFLFGKEVTFQIDEARERNAEEEYLDQVWGTAEQKMMFLQELAQNGAICGTAFVRLYPPEAGVNGSLPRIVNLDPANLDIITHDDDVDVVVEYRIVWKSGRDWKRHRIMLDIERGTWSIVQQIKTERDTEFRDDGIQPNWPYPFSPVQHCKNLPLANSAWGISDLEGADLNDAINFVASNTNKIVRHHAHPKTIAKGVTPGQIQPTAVDGMWSVPETADVFNLEMQSDLASSMEHKRDLTTAYSKITNTPELDPSQVNVGALSGFALKILYGDQMDVTRIKRNTYGDLLSRINRYALILGGKGDMDVQNKWADPLPRSDIEQAQTLEIDRRNGLSEETYLEERGYNVEREQERKAQEQTQQGNVGAALLAAFDQGGQVQ